MMMMMMMDPFRQRDRNHDYELDLFILRPDKGDVFLFCG